MSNLFSWQINLKPRQLLYLSLRTVSKSYLLTRSSLLCKRISHSNRFKRKRSNYNRRSSTLLWAGMKLINSKHLEVDLRLRLKVPARPGSVWKNKAASVKSTNSWSMWLKSRPKELVVHKLCLTSSLSNISRVLLIDRKACRRCSRDSNHLIIQGQDKEE